MIDRKAEVQAVRGLLNRHRVVGLIGARQVGKTTLAHMVTEGREGSVTFFDMENPEDQARLQDPMLALKDLRGLVVVDEVQRAPDLFAVLRVLADRRGSPARFLILGSASPELLRQSSETLAGRIVYHEMGGFSLDEIGIKNRQKLWLRGGMPRSYLARSSKESWEWRRGFVQTFLERDLPQLGINISAITMRRFWTMLAHYHAQTWNASEFGRSFGVADTTVRGYLDRLASALAVRLLHPWHENIGKRQVKAPKVYVADCGLLHTLLNLRTQEDLETHPKVGASWEGFVIDQIMRQLGAEKEECFFWATHAGAELDLFVNRGQTRLGFEVKRTTAPAVTPSMRHAVEDLKLTQLDVIHAGESTFPLAPRIRAVSLSRLLTDLPSL
ncbi:MAG: ATP-binding protein [Verrucomicrobia bacterium]|nr:ATP-binding protein [Verrucomicrobiota bacterium]